MKTRKKSTQEKIQQFIGIEKLNFNQLLQIRGGGEPTPDDKIIE